MCEPDVVEKLRTCRGILLDFGGTLDSDGEHWLDRFYDLYETAGMDLPQHDIKRAFYRADELCCSDPHVNELGLRSLMRHHVRLQFSELGLADESREAWMVEGFCSKTERIFRRNVTLLERLGRFYRLGVVSNFYGNVAVLCQEAGLTPSLQVIVDSTRVGVSKPDSGIFKMALDGLELAPEETIFVGDSYDRDMLPALRMGMKAIWLKGPNPRLPDDPEPVDCCIDRLPELKFLLP